MSGSVTLVTIGSLPSASGLGLSSLAFVNTNPAALGGNNQIEQVSIAALLDSLFGTLQGTVIYRGAGASGAGTWTGLAPGTAGEFLSTGGASANPSWAFASSQPSGQQQGYGFYVPPNGLAYSASQVLFEMDLFNNTNFAANMTGFNWYADVAATNSATLSLWNAGTQFGTVVFPALSAIGTITSTAITPASANTLLQCKAPATPDATLSGVRGRFLGTRP